MAGVTEQEPDAFIVKSEIHLKLRSDDQIINAEKLRQFGLFRRMRRQVSIEKFPGSIVQRRYRKGEVVFQQGQPGGTAFYIPTAEDLVRLAALEAGQEPPADPVVDSSRNLQVLSALIIPSTNKVRPRGFLDRWFGSSGRQNEPQSKFASIPSDGPSNIDFKTREAPLLEGNLFGEMSCISFMPRSATVVAKVDCWLLEFNRNVFDQIRSDKNHQEWLEDEYKRRTLDTHLRQFQLFKDLNDSQIQLLKENVSLESVAPGHVICEEGEKWSETNPLDVFIVRNGVVQVVVNAHLSVQLEDVPDWTRLCLLVDQVEPDPTPTVPPTSASPATAGQKPISPLESMRQKGIAKEAVAHPSPAAAPAVVTTSNVPKMSPLDLIRAKQAAAKAPPGEVPIEKTAPEAAQSSDSAPPTSPKLSPLEQIRAKQAAAKAAELKDTKVTPENRQPADAALPATALSPLEQIRAKQAAMGAADQANPPGTGTKESSPAATPPTTGLSPLEQIRAKQAAAKAAELKDTKVTPEDGQPADAALPAKTLSPLEQIRAKQAAAKDSAPSSPDRPDQSVLPTTQPPEGSKKPSPLELMRTKHAAKAGPTSAGDESAKAAENGKNDPPTSAATVPPLLRKPAAELTGSVVFIVKSWLNRHVLQAIHQIAKGELQGDALSAAQTVILSALNELTRNSEFLSHNRIASEILSKPVLIRKTASFPKGIKGIAKEWSELELRTTGRAVLSEIFPNLIRQPVETSGPPRVLAYLSRGECIGEIAVVRGTERNATCIAYNHPSSESSRDFGNVELVRIRGSAFRTLMAESEKLERSVKTLAEKRLKQLESFDERATEPDLIASAEFQQMGLFQGSRLLVIDLDSCTRCGDCVEACVETHDDGISRLFLDGPRYDRFLVPSACRNCLNPVCMIGCPVGSIGRGENGQIEIYDWCIGCSACADQCPYDSIQMHDLGLIPEESSGWLYANRRSLQDDWFRQTRIGSGWRQGHSPFRWQGEFLREWLTAVSASSKEQPLHFCFRHEFRLPKKSQTQRYRISINDARRKGAVDKTRIKTSKLIGVWLNGEKLEVSENSIELHAGKFNKGNNILAIEVMLDSRAEYGQFVLSACLDAIAEVGTQAMQVLGDEVHSEMDLVTRRAAVCDLCSHIPSQQPACVSSCPHDAAIRVNPMTNFPT